MNTTVSAATAAGLVPATGPRGGTTTINAAGMVRKNLWISHEENEALRRLSFDERRSEADLIREGLRHVLAKRAR